MTYFAVMASQGEDRFASVHGQGAEVPVAERPGDRNLLEQILQKMECVEAEVVEMREW